MKALMQHCGLPPEHNGRPRPMVGAGAIMLIALTVAVGLGTSSAHAAAPKPGQVSRLPVTLPNYFWDATPPQGAAQFGTSGTGIFADPVNNLIFESNPGSYYYRDKPYPIVCPALVSFDATTFAPVTIPSVEGPCPSLIPDGSNSKGRMVAVDSTDRLLFAGTGSASFGVGFSILVIDEVSLKVLDTWTLPSGAEPNLHGLTWNRATDELIVLSDYQGSALFTVPSEGVSVTDYGIRPWLTTHKATSNWSVLVAPCAQGLSNTDFGAPAVKAESQPFVFVPCILSPSQPGPNDGITSDKEGVVALPLSDVGCAPQVASCPKLDATGSAVTTVASAPAQSLHDFIYDPGDDRGFMPEQTSSGVTTFVFDGRTQTFIGRIATGDAKDQNDSIFGVDHSTGRFYALGHDSGLSLIEGRRTPVLPGGRFADLNGWTNYLVFPVLPADARHPYARALVNFGVGDQSNQCSNCEVPYFAVLADAVPASLDPPANAIDGSTYQGTPPPGSILATTYAANAEGYGYHLDAVGISGVIDNPANTTQGGQSVPLGKGSRDVLAAWTRHVSLKNGNASGKGTPFGHADDGTGSAATQGGAIPAGPAPQQAWPFLDAACSHPGAGASSADANGYQTTSGYDANGNAQQQPVPGSDSVAKAHVDCAFGQPVAGSAVGSSLYDAGGGAVPGLTAIGVSHAESTSSVAPPQAGIGSMATTTATARGIHIDLGAAGALAIGAVTQTATAQAAGRPGTAKTSRTSSIGDVAITTGGQTQVLCSGVCADAGQTLQSINATFPTLLRAELPAADDRYAPGSSSNGSPGGYAAVVDASLAQQTGDQQFNGMTGEDKVFLPALRVIVYDDGKIEPTRMVADFAGVQDDAELGIDVLPPPTAEQLAAVTPSAAAAAAGVSRTTGCCGIASDSGTPGDGGVGQAGSATAATAGSASAPGATSATFTERVLSGIGWLRRSPGAVLQMLGFLGLLGLPFLLMERRRLWIRDIFGGTP